MSKYVFSMTSGMLLGILFCIPVFAQETDSDYKKMLDGIYDGFETIQPAEAEKLTGKKNVYFLDVREWKEFEVSHISGALWVGSDQVNWKKIDQIPKEAQLIVYCSVGARSQDLGKKLKEKGYTSVQNLYGGLFLWANQSRKMTDSNGKTTDQIHGYNKEWGKWIKKGKVVY